MTERQAPYVTRPNRETMIGLINSDARMIPLADGVVQCVITSPPYWGLRDYGIDGQIGLERTPEAYVANIVAVMRECWRVLRDNGTLWLNLGDSFYGGKGSNGNSKARRTANERGYVQSCGTVQMDTRPLDLPQDGLKPKDLVGIPWRVAFALQQDGWYLRSDIIWSKPNPMPESVTDRPTKAHEYIFLLAKQEQYYYDADAIREPIAESTANDHRLGWYQAGTPERGYPGGNHNHGGGLLQPDPNGRNKRSIWTVATQPYSGAHFATFPPALVKPMILAGSHPGDLVLDPFTGTATVGRVCIKHGRSFVGLDLNMKYIDLAEYRTSKVQIAMSI